MRELELRRIVRNVAALTAVTFGTLTMPNAIRAQQTDDPRPAQDRDLDIDDRAREAADDAEDGADWGWLGLLGLAGLLGLRRRDDTHTRTVDTDTQRF